MSDTQTHSIELKNAQFEFLQAVAAEYNLPDVSKAVRCLIEFARHEAGAKDRVFGDIRCTACGPPAS